MADLKKLSVKNTFSRWARRKTYGLEEVDPNAGHGPTTLAKVLNTFDLTLLGVGSTLGVGIYVLAGSVALDTAGPAVCISFMVAAIASAFAAMSYAEFGARVPKAGSAYIYSYVTVGEFIAFVIGWNLILEYLIGTASVARAFSANLDALTNYTMSQAFEETFPLKSPGLSPYVDFFCMAVTLALAVLLGLGVRSSAIFTNIFTFVNITVVIFVIIGGSINADPNNWRIPAEQVPEGFGKGGFFPYGFSGVMAGAAKCFFAFVGFDSIASTGEEAKNAKKSIPFSINLTLLIVFFAYFGVSTVITLMWPYYLQDPNTPLVYAFEQIGWDIAAMTISIGSLFGLAASLLGAMIPLPRVIYAIAKDGLMFRFLAKINPRFQTPLIATAVSGVLAAVLGSLFDLDSLVDMMSIGTLLAYTLVAISVLILRYEAAEVDLLAMNGEVDKESRMPWQRLPTKQSSRKAIYSTVAYCILSLVLCGMFVLLEENTSPWVLFGVGISFGPMVMLVIYLIMLPRSKIPLYFKVPGVPVVPCLSVIINTYLMLKLDGATWVRFGVWMAIGFLLYFGYGMWNSSEEYIRRGKIPPGGTAPLPDKNTVNAVASVTTTASIGLVPDPTNKKMSLTRLVPVTSLDDDDDKQHDAHEEKGHDEAAEAFALANLKAHEEAQEIFDKARLEKEQAIFMAAMLHSHELSEHVFQQLRAEKEAEQMELQKSMAAFAQQAAELHSSLEQIFANISKEEQVAIDTLSEKPPLSPRPAGPLGAIMQELKTKTAVIDPTEGDDEGNNLGVGEHGGVVPISETTPVSSGESPAGSRTSPDSPGSLSKASNTSSELMLNELKKAFNSALAAHPSDGDEDGVSVENMCKRFHVPSVFRAAFAEFLGTYILVVIGNGSIAQSQLTNGEKGDYFTINWGWALGCSLGMLVSANVSGGHLNPAVTMALALVRRFPWKRLPVYWCAQYMGALAASGTVLGVYHVQKAFWKEKSMANSALRRTLQNLVWPPFLLTIQHITRRLVLILSTMIFTLVICVVTDKRYSNVPNFLQPLYVGFTLLAIGVAYGSNGGYALNPARDLAPRLVSFLGGWGLGVFSFRDYNWFWIFLVGPHVGAILGVCIFHLILKNGSKDISERVSSIDVSMINPRLWHHFPNRGLDVWLAVALLTAVVLSAAAPVKDEAKVAKISTEVTKADVADSTLASTDITGTDEDSEATETILKATTGEKNEHEKEKSENVKQIDDGEHEKEENEENENEENENEEEDSDEGESEEEDSEESEGKKSLKKKIEKAESEEENNDNKADAVEIPSVFPTRSRPVDSPVAIQPHQPVDTSRSGSRMSKSENFFSPAKSSYETARAQHNPRFDTGEILTRKSSAVELQFWHTPVVPAKPLNEERPAVSPSVEFHQTEERKTKHPKWFFNTPKSKPSEDSSTKKESSTSFVAESPISKPADVQVSAWPVTNTSPAVRGSYNPTISQSDHGNSQPKWFFKAAPKSSDGFGREGSRQPADIERPAHKSTTTQSQPWSKPVIPSPAPSMVHVPVHNAADVSQPPTRKVYPKWFFNIKN
ncbi:hypothetical protein GHT06_009410 [Daphnia sinensis]|uniref:Cationic amino acid transporter C-terminal domain-containing protein n=1 Tax=Daphnia sinensis TaxID=1820382 RepID=A0AAD5Q1H3_9CRUS|nr:hypothetical protein GHT06_009410 [Daphnia sinensis]